MKWNWHNWKRSNGKNNVSHVRDANTLLEEKQDNFITSLEKDFYDTRIRRQQKRVEQMVERSQHKNTGNGHNRENVRVRVFINNLFCPKPRMACDNDHFSVPNTVNKHQYMRFHKYNFLGEILEQKLESNSSHKLLHQIDRRNNLWLQ
jgi:hypothetical protein